MPALRAFDPELVIVSAGYDAHRDDPLAGMQLDARAYHGLATRLGALGRPVVAILEGGYDLEAVASSSEATLEVLVEGARGAQVALRAASCHPAAAASCARTIAALGDTPLGAALARDAA